MTFPITLGETKMKLTFLATFAVLMSLASPAHAEDMITKTSKHNYHDTQTKLEAALKEKNLTLFAKIDHGAGATAAGLTMQPETLFIFGNPKGGTPFMVAAATAGIDLPLKALVWQDKAGKVFVTYNTLDFLVQRHKISGMDEPVKKLNGALDAITNAATQ
jgi:uncharacterized protein (DUF302 family)